MKSKTSNISRRTFAKRAGLLVSALGVSGGIQSGLMDSILRKATKQWGGDALAAEPNAVHFCVEILFRAGFQFNALFPSAGHKNDARGTDLNVYSSPNGIVPMTVGGKTLYYANYGAGDGIDALMQTASVQSGRLGIAYSEAVSQPNDNHTSLWMTRAPNSMAPSPANLHAMSAVAADVQGVEWNNGVDTMNQRGNTRDLSMVRSRNEFVSLFKDVPAFFAKEELQLIVGEISKGAVVAGRKGTIGTLDEMFLVSPVPGAQDFAQVSLAGRGQAQLSLADQLALTDIAGNFTNLDQAMGGTQLATALATAAKAFAAGAMTTITISLESDDWHSDISMLDDPNSKQGLWNRYVGNALAGFVKSVETMVDPFDPSKSIVDSLLVSMSSEFSRSPNRLGGADNGDGGAQNFCFLGSRVKTGTFGNITGGGVIQGFDPVSGALAPANLVGASSVWKTAGRLMGISDATLNGYVPDSSGKVISAIVK